MTVCRISPQLSKNDEHLVKSIAKTMVDMIREFYIANKIQFHFIIYGEVTNHIKDLINEISKELNDKVAINIEHIKNILKWDHKLYQSAIFLMKSKWSLSVLHVLSQSTKERYILVSQSVEKLKYLVYAEEIRTLQQLNKTLNIFRTPLYLDRSDLRYFEFFITQDGISVNLSVNLLYSEHKCMAFEPTVLNNFDIKTQKWNRKLENFDHFENFYGCLLHFSTGYGYWYIEEINNCLNCPTQTNLTRKLEIFRNNDKYRGLFSELVNIMANKNNFSFHYTLKVIENMYGMKNYMPKLLTQENVVVKNIIHLKVNSFGNEPESSYIAPLFEIQYYFLLTPNDFYTNYEKLTMPFDFITWIFLLLIYGLTFGIIFGIHLSSRWLRLKFFGKGINNPGYNALGIFFGISQLRLPSESFSRAILLIFIWFCLIIRTCYQSKMFEFMTSDMRKPLPETFDDLREMNYTVLVQLGEEDIFFYYYKNIFGQFQSEKEFVFIISRNIFYSKYEETLMDESNGKYAFFTNTFIHKILNSTFSKSLQTMKNEKYTKPFSLTQLCNNLLLHNINNVIKNLKPSGIIDHLVEYGFWFQYRPPSVKDEETTKVLSMADLEFYFVIWLPCCFASFLVFIIEIRSLWIRRQLRKLIGVVNILKVLKARLSDYHDRW